MLRVNCVMGEKAEAVVRPLFHSIRKIMWLLEIILKMELTPESFMCAIHSDLNVNKTLILFEGYSQKSTFLVCLLLVCPAWLGLSACLPHFSIVKWGLLCWWKKKWTASVEWGAQILRETVSYRRHILNWVSADGLLHQCSQLQELKPQPNSFLSHSFLTFEPNENKRVLLNLGKMCSTHLHFRTCG